MTDMNVIGDAAYQEKYEEIRNLVKAGAITDTAAAMRLTLVAITERRLSGNGGPRVIGVDYGREHRLCRD